MGVLTLLGSVVFPSKNGKAVICHEFFTLIAVNVAEADIFASASE